MRRVLASALATIAALALADVASAADPIVDWSSGRIEGVVLPGEAPDGRRRCGVAGQVRYEGVQKPGDPLLLAGAIPFVLGLALRRPLRSRYAEVELRRMRALDLGGPVPR